MVIIDLFNAIIQPFIIGFSSMWEAMFRVYLPIFELTLGDLVILVIGGCLLVGLLMNLIFGSKGGNNG